MGGREAAAGAMPLPDQVLISRVAAALSGADAEQSLKDASAVLQACGFVAHTPLAGDCWLEVKRAGRTLALAVAAEPSDAGLRETLEHLLSMGLLRAAEQEELRRVRERMEMLSAASFEGIFIHENGVILDANQRAAELLGYAPEEVLGERMLRDCVAPEDLPRVFEVMRERFEGTYVISLIRKDGTRFRAELQSKQGKLGEHPVRVVAVRDVTERERTARLLLESETRLRDLAGQAFDFLVFSRDGVAVEVAGGLERVLGYQPVEWVGRKLVDFVAPTSVPLATQVLAEQRLGAYQIVILSRTGEQVPVEIVGVTSTLDGQSVRVAGVRDQREQKRLQEERRELEAQLSRSQRLESLGVLAGGVAHDFNNLLVGVLGNAELLSSGLNTPDEQELCQAIVDAAKRAADLTAQLLAYAGQRDLGRRQPVDLGVVWRELSSLLEARISKNARLDLRLGEGSVVLGDRATLTQVLMNLLTNASDALEDRAGTIEIRTSRIRDPDSRWDGALGAAVAPGDWVQIEVMDTGIGMTPPTLLRVFEPFFSTKEKGHGLGLASCLGIVSAHGGALSVESKPGQGSRFSVLLPAANRRISQPPRVVSQAPGAQHKILVIDDESVVRSLLRRSLERRGYAVVEAPDGNAGIQAVREADPDLVVLDMSMPDLDGAEVLRRLRAEGFSLPIVIASGHFDGETEQRLERGAFQGFLRKPFSVAELVTAIEAALDSPPQNGS